MSYRYILILLCLATLASCEKKEDALVLPPAGSSSHVILEMGENYTRQLFYNFETQSIVATSDPSVWDLAFEASAGGRHVFLNGGNKIFVYNTHVTDLSKVTALPSNLLSSGAGWQFDASCGLPDSTAVGDWFDGTGASKGEVYIIQTNSGDYEKIRMESVDNTHYTFKWASLNATTNFSTQVLTKDSNYNFSYFSFTGGVVQPDAPKDSWDIVFTRYEYIFRNYPSAGLNFPYDVTGVLLNPNKVVASADSVTSFANINLGKAQSAATTNFRDIIGYDWKQYSQVTGLYQVNSNKCYMVHTRNNQIYKLHFLGFYSSTGIKGSPDMEYERLL